jgi:hypothetical protein
MSSHQQTQEIDMIELTQAERDKFIAYCAEKAAEHDTLATAKEAQPGQDGVVANNDRKRAALYAGMARLLRNS